MRNLNVRRLLFDTNVLLDALIEGRPESTEAWEVLKRCNGGGAILTWYNKATISYE